MGKVISLDEHRDALRQKAFTAGIKKDLDTFVEKHPSASHEQMREVVVDSFLERLFGKVFFSP